MAALDRYDLLPLLGLLLVILALVLTPLPWTLRQARSSGRLLTGLRLAALFLSFGLLLVGASIRLSDSGLGCADWPGCYGHGEYGAPTGAVALPPAPDAGLQRATALQTVGLAWLHHGLAGAVGGLLALLALWRWRAWRQHRSGPKPWLESAALLWLLGLGAGALWAADLARYPLVPSLQLLGALGLLALLGAQAARDVAAGLTAPLRPGLRRLLHGCWALLLLQSALGAWVSSNEAVLACSGFPTCQGRWWPPMDFSQGFALWRQQGQTTTGAPIGLAALTAVHYLHRLMAGVVLACLMALAWLLNRHKSWRGHSRVLAALIGLQLASGLGNMVLGWPLLGAVLHTGGAAALLLILTWIRVQAASAGRRPEPTVSA